MGTKTLDLIKTSAQEKLSLLRESLLAAISIGKTYSEEELLKFVCSSSGKILNSSIMLAGLKNSSENNWHFIFCKNHKRQGEPLPNEISRSLIEIFNQILSVQSNISILTEKNSKYEKLFSFFNAAPLMIAPLKAAKKELGFILIDWKEGPLASYHQFIFEMLANQTASALERIQLHDELKAEYDKARLAFLQVANAIGGTLDTEKVIDSIAKATVKALDVDDYILFLREEKQNIPYILSKNLKQHGEKLLKLKFWGKKDSIGWITAHSKSLAIQNLAATIWKIPKILLDADFVSLAGVPITNGYETIGVLAVYSKDKRKFSCSNLQIMSSFAGQISVVLEKEKLLEDMEKMEKWEEVLQSTTSMELKIPSRREFAVIARNQAETIAERFGFDDEEIQDIKAAVGEAADNAIQHGSSKNGVDLKYMPSESEIAMEIRDYGKGFDTKGMGEFLPDTLSEHGRGIFMMKSFMDDVKLYSKIGEGTKIILYKKRKSKKNQIGLFEKQI